MNRRGPNTDPWYTTTLTSHSSLKKVFTHDLLLASTYMACNILPNHSSTPRWRAHHSTFRGTLLQAFFKLSKCHVQFPVFCKIVLLKLHKNKNCICCTSTGAEAKLHLINVNCVTDDVFDHTFNKL